MRSIINEILTEGRVEDAKDIIRKHYLVDEGQDYTWVVDHLVEKDPSGNNKYLMWMVKRMIDDEEDTRDNTEGALIELVTDFHLPAVQARVPSTDINYYKNTQELTDAVVIALEGMREKTSKQQVAKGTNKIVEDDRWLILHPQTKESSCKYGQGTKWCTSMADASHYENYTKDGNLYYIIDKSKELGRYYKVALYYTWDGEEQWYDAEDNKLSDNMVELIESMLPEGYMTQIQQYHDQYQPPTEPKLNPNNLGEFFRDFVHYNINSRDLGNILGRIVTNTGVWIWDDDYFRDGDGIMAFQPQEESETNNVSFFSTPWVHGTEGVPLDLESYTKDGEGESELVWRADNQRVFGMEREEIVDKFNIPADYLEEFGTRGDTNDAGWMIMRRYADYIKGYLSSDKVVEWFEETVGLPETTTWESTSWVNSYKFENQKTAKLANAFIDYIKMAEENGVMATRKDFLEFINKPATPGYFSMFFSAINAAGIVEKHRKGRQFYYTLGPNYEAYKAGTLKRANE